MYRGHKIGVAIPCYNVEGQIAQVLEGIPDFVDLTFPVNDRSTDRTGEILTEYASGKIRPLDHDHNQGVGGAVVSGWNRCLEEGMDILIKFDGDGQMDPQGISSLIDAIIDSGAKYAKGNRFLHIAELYSMPFVRKIGNIILTFLTKMASGYWHIFDPQNGFLAVTSESYAVLDTAKLAKRYFFENSMLINLNIHSIPAIDIPMPARYGDEQSNLKIMDILITFPVFLLKGFFYRIFQRYLLRDFSPVIVLLIMGLFLTGFGTGFGIVKLIYYWRLEIPAPAGTVITAALPIILGYQSLLQALLLDVVNSPRPTLGPWQK
ncbi:MAG: glycosyltransferase family 2 protein [bacterium]|nr:glycosyltransferase family 2 protein [bacterium]